MNFLEFTRSAVKKQVFQTVLKLVLTRYRLIV